MNETEFKKEFLDRVKREFPDCEITRGNSATKQGIPDTFVFYDNAWVALEFKISPDAATRPNQSWYVERFNKMSYATFVYPDNADEVFREIQHTFNTRG